MIGIPVISTCIIIDTRPYMQENSRTACPAMHAGAIERWVPLLLRLLLLQVISLSHKNVMADIELKKMAWCDEKGNCGVSDQGTKDLSEAENKARTFMADAVDENAGSSLSLALSLISSEYDAPNVHAEDKGKSSCFQKAQAVTDEDGSFKMNSSGNGKEESHADLDQSDQRPGSDPPPQSNTTAQPHCLVTESLVAASQDQDETSVTVPIAKLQQLVEYGIQVLQESRKRIKSVQVDPERNTAEVAQDNSQLSNVAAEAKSIVPPASNSVESSLGGTKRKIATWNRTEPARAKVIGRIHDHPWPIKNIEIDPTYTVDMDLLNGLSKLETFREHFEVAWSKYFEDFFLQKINYPYSPEIRKVWLRRRLSTHLFSRYSYNSKTENTTAILISYMKYGDSNQRSTEISAHVIGSILEFCYKNKVLKQPRLIESTLSITEIAKYQLQMKTVILAISILNDCFNPLGFKTMGSVLIEEFPIEEILALSLIELRTFFETSMFDQSELEIATGNTIQTDSLNIIALRTIGNLKIYWTEYIEEHLILNIPGRMLYLAYPRLHPFSQFGRLQTTLIDPGQICSRKKKDKFDECSYTWFNDGIAASWAMIFSYQYGTLKCQKSYLDTALRFLHFSKNPMVVLKRAYEGISFDPVPYPYCDPDPIMYPWQYDYRDPAHLSRAEIEKISNYHVSTLGALWDADMTPEAHQKITFEYSNFRTFENRVRQLKFYMDSQKPRGFRQLWRDKRDALNYYTFWGVIIFGASTLFLAIVSLAVSAAQAVAAFKALDMPPSSH
ncbi:hypothetical protein BGAL_0583g00050 [Botrytis galanthina]|uniref:Uncharacterized protein n=1 Tax=Botrytis galanthina TaxID=278940 RepID=A0A4S8QIZ8_9HELO|nr:hypothetical protein BGAL_0583g00050 [Botrytis galanthina]